MTLRLFAELARYNSGVNRRLIAACATLDREALRHDRGAFFGSIWGTLNHLMVGDGIWMTRFEGGEIASTGLDAILFDDFEALATARLAMDVRIERFMERLTPDFASGSIAYVNNEGRALVDPAWLLLLHFFNHQTHHRGQVHAMLSQAGVDAPVLDLHRVLRP